jgi:hypothetical protein
MCQAHVDSPLGQDPCRRTGGRAKAGDGSVQCGGCGRTYEPGSWLALPLVGTLNGEAIAAHVVKWPRGVRIEIRRCGRCGRSIARTDGREGR